MKNRLKFLYIFSVLALLLACEKEYEALNDYSDVEWYTSAFRGEKQVAINGYMSFSDLSQNTLEHSWSFSEESGCKFLTGNISGRDSIFTNFIDEDKIGDTLTADQTIQVLFTKPGLQNVRLRNTFKEFVEFKGTNNLAAVKEGDVWVIDTTFVVDVFDSIQSAFKVFYENVEISSTTFDQQVQLSDSASWPVYEIMAGEALKFVDMTTVGRPNSTSWYVGGGSPSFSADSAATVHFYRLGTYFVRMESKRIGQNIPGGYKSKFVPLKVKVNKSTLPFERVNEIVELNDETIQISVSGETAPFSGKENDFTVHVTNPNGFDKLIEVKRAKVNSENGTLIDLTLTEPIYNSDNITVSYVGGTIYSQDERDLAGFTDVSVKMHAPELIVGGGFEEGGTAWLKGSDHIATNVNEYSTDESYEGTYSQHLVTNDLWARNSIVNANLISMQKDVVYKLRWRLKVVSSMGWGGYEVRLNRNGEINNAWGNNWTPYGAGDGLWKTQERIFTFSEADTDIGIQILSYHVTETYWDDLSLIVFEERPTE